jgi:hypothetical protein
MTAASRLGGEKTWLRYRAGGTTHAAAGADTLLGFVVAPSCRPRYTRERVGVVCGARVK